MGCCESCAHEKSPGPSYEEQSAYEMIRTEAVTATNCLHALPVTKAKEATAEECSICLEYVQVGDVQKFLPCGHGFHAACIDPWLRNSVFCPTCRIDVRDS